MSTQIMTKEKGEALDYVEFEMRARVSRNAPRSKRPLVAAFIFDTADQQLTHYIIDGLVAKFVTKEMFT